MSEYRCPSCGGELKTESIFTRMIVCRYCGQTSFIVAGKLNLLGKFFPLADFGSPLAVGKSGKVRNTEKTFKVIGRLRFDYEDGFWDEWLLEVSNSNAPVWLHEDEGEFLWMEEIKVSSVPSYEKFSVGQDITIRDFRVFITEKNKAVLSGVEGEIPHQLKPQQRITYADGIVHQKKFIIGIEYMPGEPTSVYVGEPLQAEDLILDI